MANKPTAKKQPFVIEPLNWVAPDSDSRNEPGKQEGRDESSNRKDTER